MKPILFTLLSATTVIVLGACDRHSFEKTQVLHEKYQKHDTHGAEAAKHDAPAHGDKKAH